ncbi:hypothetical protein DNTS_021719 [Danionella cerebrum]|uniref:SEA domain-containing protein n=1 Tax=Danionella cerebrum TaxID=2873325 RepID=A0A553NJ78_9TELE|nr:hypothetical protein DNTS_021719 [Danionella translucida]
MLHTTRFLLTWGIFSSYILLDHYEITAGQSVAVNLSLIPNVIFNPDQTKTSITEGNGMPSNECNAATTTFTASETLDSTDQNLSRENTTTSRDTLATSADEMETTVEDSILINKEGKTTMTVGDPPSVIATEKTGTGTTNGHQNGIVSFEFTTKATTDMPMSSMKLVEVESFLTEVQQGINSASSDEINVAGTTQTNSKHTVNADEKWINSTETMKSTPAPETLGDADITEFSSFNFDAAEQESASGTALSTIAPKLSSLKLTELSDTKSPHSTSTSETLQPISFFQFIFTLSSDFSTTTQPTNSLFKNSPERTTNQQTITELTTALTKPLAADIFNSTDSSLHNRVTMSSPPETLFTNSKEMSNSVTSNGSAAPEPTAPDINSMTETSSLSSTLTEFKVGPTTITTAGHSSVTFPIGLNITQSTSTTSSSTESPSNRRSRSSILSITDAPVTQTPETETTISYTETLLTALVQEEPSYSIAPPASLSNHILEIINSAQSPKAITNAQLEATSLGHSKTDSSAFLQSSELMTEHMTDLSGSQSPGLLFVFDETASKQKTENTQLPPKPTESSRGTCNKTMQENPISMSSVSVSAFTLTPDLTQSETIRSASKSYSNIQDSTQMIDSTPNETPDSTTVQQPLPEVSQKTTRAKRPSNITDEMEISSTEASRGTVDQTNEPQRSLIVMTKALVNLSEATVSASSDNNMFMNSHDTITVSETLHSSNMKDSTPSTADIDNTSLLIASAASKPIATEAQEMYSAAADPAQVTSFLMLPIQETSGLLLSQETAVTHDLKNSLMDNPTVSQATRENLESISLSPASAFSSAIKTSAEPSEQESRAHTENHQANSEITSKPPAAAGQSGSISGTETLIFLNINSHREPLDTKLLLSSKKLIQKQL